MYLIANGRLFTRDPQRPYIEDGGVVTEGERIIAVGTAEELKLKYPQAELVDAHGQLIMPAFINAHTHIYSGLARGLSINGYNPTNFYEILDGMWWKLDRNLTLEDTKASAYATYLECIRNGVTTIFDHHASFKEIPGSLFAIAGCAKEMGIRSCLCYEVSDRDGEEKCDQAIKENADFIKYCQEKRDPMLSAMFGMHALFTISDKTFEKCVKANDGKTGYHIHICEGLNDVVDSRDNYHMLPVDRLVKWGILGEKTILGHCIHLTEPEMDKIAETNTMVVNNPESNMGNAVGCSPVLKMFEKGILLGLGTDAYTHDMLESLKVALTIQRHNAGMPNVGWNEVTTMLFKNNAKVAGKYFDIPLGVIKEGAAADIIVMDYTAFTPLSADNLDGHMIFGMNGRQCRTTMANGRLLYKDRQFVDIDEEKLSAQILATAQKLWGRVNS
ncbi:MAG: putative aminohydrolase SsnA [Ruminococcus sp.]|nr:putative aminohydrolase SsnA [Ruminococcus sp.]MBQ4238227.1 putative aminohydrolase SsnA [Ruminococcus sp.]